MKSLSSRRSGMLARRAAPFALAVAAVGVIGATAAQSAAEPVWAQTLPAPVPAAAKAAADAQTQADQADRAAIDGIVWRAQELDRQRAAEAAAAAAAEAARAQEQAEALADPRAVAARLAAERGWGAEQFSCLNKLWTRESQWQYTADNPTSSAYGIPQALPGKKMASAGADWETNPATQIRWGLNYIGNVYGTPCGAWAHSESHNWY